jgi:copper(I)-binding protein
MTLLNIRISVAIVLLFLTGQSGALAGSAVDVGSPWIREAPPASTVLAAYMVLTNNDDSPHTITRIDSPEFSSSQIHRTVVEDGIAKMLPVEQLVLPAGDSVTLEPGGMHLMLFDPSRPLKDGDIVDLVIHDDAGESVTISVPVVRVNAESGHVHHH